jgi:hypothetical protein
VHIAIFGETGAGKTVTIGQLVYQNIQRREGFMVIDPHGDLARETLAAIPDDMKDRVIYLNAASSQWFNRAIKVNPLECKDAMDRHIVAMNFVNSLKNMYYRSWGDRLEAILRNCVNAVVELPDGATLWDLSKLISSNRYLAEVTRIVQSPGTKNFLINVLPNYKKDAGSAAYNKLDKILTTPYVAAMFDTKKSSFDIGMAMDGGMVVIADLSSGMSDDIANFVGSILLNMVYVEAMRRVDVDREDRKPFYLYVDEAHRFSAEELQSLLTTVRKFNVKVTLASQTINNFPPDIQKSFGALCKTIILFKSDLATARTFETVMPVTPDEITSLSLNTFAFYSQAQPPVTGVAVTKLVLARNAVVDDWKGERARYSVEKFGTGVSMDKYVAIARKQGIVPDWLPIDIKVVYLLRTRRMTKQEVYTELVRHYGEKDVDPELLDRSVEALRLAHIIKKQYISPGPEGEGRGEQEVLELEYSAYNLFFNTSMIGARTGKEKHRAAIIYLAESFWNSLKYCRLDLGESHQQLADLVVVDHVQWYEDGDEEESEDGSRKVKRHDLSTWGEATAIEVETDPVHREAQVVENYNKNREQGLKVQYVVFRESDGDAIRRFLTEKRGIPADTYSISSMDIADVERFRKEKLGALAEDEGASITGAGGISPDEMRAIALVKGKSIAGKGDAGGVGGSVNRSVSGHEHVVDDDGGKGKGRDRGVDASGDAGGEKQDQEQEQLRQKALPNPSQQRQQQRQPAPALPPGTAIPLPQPADNSDDVVVQVVEYDGPGAADDGTSGGSDNNESKGVDADEGESDDVDSNSSTTDLSSLPDEELKAILTALPPHPDATAAREVMFGRGYRVLRTRGGNYRVAKN